MEGRMDLFVHQDVSGLESPPFAYGQSNFQEFTPHAVTPLVYRHPNAQRNNSYAYWQPTVKEVAPHAHGLSSSLESSVQNIAPRNAASLSHQPFNAQHGLPRQEPSLSFRQSNAELQEVIPRYTPSFSHRQSSVQELEHPNNPYSSYQQYNVQQRMEQPNQDLPSYKIDIDKVNWSTLRPCPHRSKFSSFILEIPSNQDAPNTSSRNASANSKSYQIPIAVPPIPQQPISITPTVPQQPIAFTAAVSQQPSAHLQNLRSHNPFPYAAIQKPVYQNIPSTPNGFSYFTSGPAEILTMKCAPSPNQWGNSHPLRSVPNAAQTYVQSQRAMAGYQFGRAQPNVGMKARSNPSMGDPTFPKHLINMEDYS